MFFKSKNIQDSCFIFVFGNILFWYSLLNHYNGPTVEWKMSPSLFPILISIFLILLSVSLFFDGLNQIKKEKKNAADVTSATAKDLRIRPVMVTIVISIAYFILMRVITFIPSTILYLCGMIFFLGERRYWLIAIIAIISTLTIYALFDLALGVMLP